MPPHEGDEYRRGVITRYLRTFRCEINHLHSIAHALTPDLLAMDFNRMVREYGWIVKTAGVTNVQILKFVKMVQDLAEITGQAIPPPAHRAKVRRDLRHMVIDRDAQTCRYCARKGTKRNDPDGRRWHIDHAQPVSRGGDDSIENLVLSCADCNMAKHDLTAGEFLALTTSHAMR